ncbi:hypothetical protein NLD30_06165 [SCandidatus Aminicenantes bacterium Aminicenantia_JdfR_composite]|jgi:hypothetical protein|nr:hypothetical protein [SCandidatus Aminicenantes bacterium Aminicenantia_JdfR_composite]MCP2597607.1 hypothetical protein [Candidatus Aminicenantes bacterium AC-335-G13]MCP2620714.1 hypothetical protein [Candidatus Aminicenantes bacterium AC-334-E05]
MRNVLLFLLTIAALVILPLHSQKISEKVLVINVEVPVRVYDGNKFVDNLTIDDFEIYENGKLQKIEAVYLVKNNNIQRSEEKQKFFPKISRNFFLLFEITEYTQKLGEAVNYFIKNIFTPEDNLIIITPIKSYILKKQILKVKSKDEIVNQLKGLLKRDIALGSFEYKSLVKDLEGLAISLSAALSAGESGRDLIQMGGTTSSEYQEMPVDEQLMRYESILRELEELRYVDQKRLLDIANFLKRKEGQKYVFLFYQREFIPQISPRVLNQYSSLFQDRPDILQVLVNLFDFYRRDTTFNIDKVKKAYSDSSISIHFLFITSPPKKMFGIQFQEQSEDIYKAFKEIADATGGYIESSSNILSSFKNALNASENYYLLYYIPKNYKRDGKFRRIEVKVKNRDYKVIHRYGYFAD